ncbi:21072_t:CDS:1, partial [Gigaspora rosea]
GRDPNSAIYFMHFQKHTYTTDSKKFLIIDRNDKTKNTMYMLMVIEK